jgi:energy-coupling factor transporter ATP-binding protein EcfA2
VALLTDILKWTETELKPWQRDAIRRLFQQSSVLSEDDYKDLYDLLKSAHGLPNSRNLVPLPLTTTHLPTVLKEKNVVVLKMLRDLKHVNRITFDQKLKFSVKGITVIYGGNGSGKSGYVRVLKRACRARDQEEKVYPDVTDPNAHTYVPEAFFDIEVDGVLKQVKWEANTVPPDELSTIAVFDSRCARVYLTSEQDVVYLPYGLDIVENLANHVLPELTQRLEKEIESINIDRKPFNHLLGETEVGQIICGLSDKTDTLKIKHLATLNEMELKRITELDFALSETDPKVKARELRLSVSRLKELVKRIDFAFAWVSDEAVVNLKSLNEVAVTASQAEKIAANAFCSGEELLPGTGESIWRSLFEAARRFSTEVAYPGHPFPYIDNGAVCPLCQQTLLNSGERLLRFENYIQEDTTKIADEKRQQLEFARQKLTYANLAIGLDNSLLEELTILDEAVGSIIRTFEDSIDARRLWILNAIETYSWEDVPKTNESPRHRLRNIAAYQLKLARTFDKASDEAKNKALKKELGELQARQKLIECSDALIALVERIKFRSILESCKKDLKTKPISEKSKELANNIITSTLKSALDDEFKKFGMDHIRTKLKERNDKGKVKYQLLLDIPNTNKLEEILSEGEQRAIALGSFMAELRLSNHSGGIVFDDPVSSLDHWRRQKIAKRLVQEAARRQVIVLTHDTSFLGQLCDEIELNNVPHLIQFLEWNGNNPGFVSEGLPWEHQGCMERIDALEKAQKVFEKMPWPIYPGKTESSQMRHQYDQLRATIERAIQDVVFSGVIKRYRDYICVNNLKGVVGFEENECQKIQQLYKRCCDVVDAHDPSSEKNTPVPTVDEFGMDIKTLKDIIEAIKSKRKKVKTTVAVP